MPYQCPCSCNFVAAPLVWRHVMPPVRAATWCESVNATRLWQQHCSVSSKIWLCQADCLSPLEVRQETICCAVLCRVAGVLQAGYDSDVEEALQKPQQQQAKQQKQPAALKLSTGTQPYILSLVAAHHTYPHILSHCKRKFL